MMKILFLDIDGVLNVCSQDRDEYGSCFHPQFVDNLKTIIDATSADIVISSTWRSSGLEVMQEMWKKRNLPGKVISVTPHSKSRHRGSEIQWWIDHFYHDINAFVIIDDDEDFLPYQLNNHLVRTSRNNDHPDHIDGGGYGLTKICAQKCIEILNKDERVC